MRRILLCIPPALAFVALQASCEDTNSGGGDGGQFVFDSGPFTPPPQQPPGTPPPPPTDSGFDAGPQFVTVVVTAQGKSKAGTEVVAHDASGAVLTTQTTDATGKAIFLTPPAMVSAMLGSPTGIGGHQIITWMGVEPGDVLATGDVELFGAQVGQYAVDQTGTLDGGASYTAQLGSCSGFYPGSFPITLPVTADCVRATNSILLSGVDNTFSNVVGYAFKRDAGAPLADGGPTPVTVGAWAAPGSTKVIAPSLDLASGYASVQLWEIADGNGYPNSSGQATTDSGTDFQTPNGFSDALQADVRYHPNSAQFSTQTISKRAAASATVTVDFASPLPLVTGATADNSNTQHPKVTITTAASLASADGGVIRVSWRGPGAEFPDQWLFVVPPSTTSVTAPSMPADATAWLPNADAAATTYEQPKILFAESDLIPSYKELRAGVALLLPYSSAFIGSDPETRVVLPAAGTLRLTTYYFQNNL